MRKVSVCVVCLLVMVTAGTPLTLQAQPSEGSRVLTSGEKLARDIFRELIEIKTTVNVGSSRAAEAMAARLKAAGFPERDVQLLGPSAQHMNLVARYRGKGTLRPILFISHLDVVEALPEDWSIDPFVFLEKEGYFYGRGTTDVKDEDADLIATLIRLKGEGFVPECDIIVALTEDEEGGDANGVQWLLANHRELIDAEFCINPDGGGGDIRSGRHVVMDLQTSEKIYSDIQLEVTNKGGHSSRPVKENAIYRLAGALTRLSNFDFPVHLNETTRKFFERSASRETGQTASDMLAILRTPPDSAAVKRLAESSAYYNALLRTTCVATMLGAGHAENALPQSARANINCRMLPEDTLERVMAQLKSVIADSQVAVKLLHGSSVAPTSPLRKDVMRALEKVTASIWPEVLVLPVMSTGGTDGKPLRRSGIPVYGVSGMFTDVDDDRAHGRDERLGVKEFYEGIEFMYRFMKALTSGS
jgi:acetylornithine deacetylase/succinyl-diaminopimelate desuccinylase-like protein